MGRLIWSPRAADDFEEICDYIARDSARYAAIVARRIVATVEEIPTFPKAGRIVPEKGDPNVR
jgi:plasmid stabilization system protein ParE